MAGIELTGLVPDPDGEPRADWDPRLATVTGEPAILHGRLETMPEWQAGLWRRRLRYELHLKRQIAIAEAVLES